MSSSDTAPMSVRFDLHDPGIKSRCALPDCAESQAYFAAAEPICSSVEAAIERGDRFIRDLRANLESANAQVAQFYHLAEPDQVVSIKDSELHTPQQRGVTFVVRETLGEGSDQFCSLVGPDGHISEWHRLTELQPATATGAPAKAPAGKYFGKPKKTLKTIANRALKTIGKSPAMPDPSASTNVERGIDRTSPQDDPTAAVAQAAEQLAREQDLSYRDALRLVATRAPQAIDAYRLAMDSGPRPPGTVPDADRLQSITQDTATRKKISLRAAARTLSDTDLAGYRRDAASVLHLSSQAQADAGEKIKAAAEALVKAQPTLRYSDAVLEVLHLHKDWYAAWRRQ